MLQTSKPNQGDAPRPEEIQSGKQWTAPGAVLGAGGLCSSALTKAGAALTGWGIKGREFPRGGAGGGGKRAPAKRSKGNEGSGEAGSGERSLLEALFKCPFS